MLTTGAARLGAGAACLLPKKHFEEVGVITKAIFEYLLHYPIRSLDVQQVALANFLIQSRELDYLQEPYNLEQCTPSWRGGKCVQGLYQSSARMSPGTDFVRLYSQSTPTFRDFRDEVKTFRS